MLIRVFATDERGSVMPIFGLAVIVLFGCAGAAVDYSRGNAVRTELQAALDATALMLQKDANKNPPVDLKQAAQNYFTAQFTRSDVTDVQVDAEKTGPDNGRFSLRVWASGKLPTTLTRVIGHTQMSIGSTTQVQWGKKLEIALVLDNTGSMAQSSKLTELKTAARNFLGILQATAQLPGMQPDDVKVAIVPFDTRVNIGTGFADEAWIDYSLRNVTKNQWTGCVIDRAQPNDVLDTTPTSGQPATYFPADRSCIDVKSTCLSRPAGSLAQALPLTNNWTDLNNKINQMAAVGCTDITIGLVWGWHALTNNVPFTQAVAPNDNLDKVILLLTDGENTQSRFADCMSGCSTLDNRTSAVCTNIKAANILIYTIRVIDGNATLLRNCASKTSMYYSVQQASELNNVFNAIAQELVSLRISR